jgi:uncharacterized membrane protein YedE/YeeE
MLEALVGHLGEPFAAALGGLAIGALFGFAAQKSRFCLRAATIDFWRGSLTQKVAVWLLAFGTAVVATQLAILYGYVDTSGVRYLNARGSLSGAMIGGAMFGVGMVLTRGCASRLLVLSANGNLRALLSGLIFAVIAQASFRGMLSPAREYLAELWTTSSPTALSLLAWMGAGEAGLFFGLVWLAGGLSMAWRQGIGARVWISAMAVGLLVTAGWSFTSMLATMSFDPQPVRSLSFSGPSANMLMMVLATPGGRFDFDAGLVPGVVLGSFLSAWLAGELKLEGFQDGGTMRRYILGAVLMGFGGMLAGGCAIGAGVSGAALFATTAWITLLSMWVAAGVADRLIDAPKDRPGMVPPVTAPDPLVIGAEPAAPKTTAFRP